MMLRKLKAGALQFTMFVIVVIALLMAGFILMVHLHDRFKKDARLVTEVVRDNNKAINQWLSKATSENLLSKDLSTTLTQIDSGYWGVYPTLHVTTRLKHKGSDKMAFIGSKRPREHPTLFLKDNNKSLVLVGNTMIEGDVQLPDKGVRTGNISGVSYYGEQLVQGNIQTIKNFPEVSQHLYDHLDPIKTVISKASNNQYITLTQNDVIKNSFFEPVKVIYEQGTINLTELTLTGNIIVYSDTGIVVDASANITDVILVAPNIEIKSHVKGRFQALASKSIMVGNDCKLSYPSALVLQPTNKINTESTDGTTGDIMINISASSSITGSIVYLGTTEKKDYRPQIFIDENTTVTGEVYCTGNMDLHGTVHGSVYTHDFIAARSGSIYQNHLYNAQIITSKLPIEFSGILFEASNKKVMKWLY